MAYVVMYFNDHGLVHNAAIAGPLSHVSKVATNGLQRYGADWVKVFDQDCTDPVWSREKVTHLSEVT